MKKKVEWRTQNRMRFESQHKTFNMQADLISIGNVMGDVQLSGFIRPRDEVECNGFVSPRGHLQEYDLGWLLGDFPPYVKDFVRQLPYAESKTMIGYEFRVWRGKKKMVMGYVVTTGEDDGHRVLKKWVVGIQRMKAESVIDEAIKYITDDGGQKGGGDDGCEGDRFQSRERNEVQNQADCVRV